MHAILTYHSIDDSGSSISVAPDVFANQVRWLRSGVVRVVSLEDLVDRPPPEDAVAITFDDGFENFATVAHPALADAGLPVTLFVVTGRLGRDNAWDGAAASDVPTLPLLDHEAVGRLGDAGVDLGSHTRNHNNLKRCSPAALVEELRGAAEDIQKLTGAAPSMVAYPYGAHDDAVCKAAKPIYRYGVTTNLRGCRRREDRLRLPRLDMYYFRRPGQLETWGTARFSGRLSLRRWGRRVRGVLGTEWGRE